jgi:DNA-binding beta-propeller fold protein YncE
MGLTVSGLPKTLTLNNDASMVHYRPTAADLTSLPLMLASPFDEAIQGIAPGPKTTEWFARFYDNEISHITAGGKLVSTTLPSSTEPQDLAVAQDGTIWFTSRGHGCAIGHLTPKGKPVTYPLDGDCYDLAIGPDGNIWVAIYTANEVVEVSSATGQVLARYGMRLPIGIATLDDYVYVTEAEPGIVAKIAPSGELTEYLLPEGRRTGVDDCWA